MSAYQFLRPLAFAKVKGPTLNAYRWLGPGALSVLGGGAYLLLPKGIDLVGDKSASDFMASFFVTLPGFFIAALAAVVAFNGGDLDKEMPGVTVSIRANGDDAAVELTLRMFLCYLFSYLTVLSFIGFFASVVGALLAPNLNHWIAMIPSVSNQLNLHSFLGTLFVGSLTFLSASVVLCTALGLYFLAERVHQTLIH